MESVIGFVSLSLSDSSETVESETDVKNQENDPMVCFLFIAFYYFPIIPFLNKIFVNQKKKKLMKVCCYFLQIESEVVEEKVDMQ